LKLYFQHSDGSHEFIRELSDNRDQLGAVSDVLEDLHKRNPKYKSYYQRTWKDDNGWTWIDVGSYTEFYIVKPD